jgi:DNA-binding CsgD family transcriptional regulator
MPNTGEVGGGSSGSVMERWPLVGRRPDVERALAALTDPRTNGVVLVGGPGLGKTRLADEVVAEAEIAGNRVLRATASESARNLPLGALAHLLPADAVLDEAEGGALDPVRLLAHARKAIRDDHGRRAVLAIDDVQHLDAVSSALLAQLVAEDSAALLLTMRSGERLPDTVAGLQRAERLVTVELRPLPDSAVDTLLHLGLGAPVEGRTSAGFRVASAGNPLVLRELVRTALADGHLVRRDGVWVLDGPMPRARQAVELLGTRLDHLEGAAKDIVEVLALAGPTRLDVVMTMADLQVLEALEADELIELRAGGDLDHDVLSLAHPLLAEAVRQQTSPLRSRSILAAHADRVEAVAGVGGDDVLQIATWRLDAGASIDPALLESAAVLARYASDLTLTARLAAAAERKRPTLRAGVLHGEALHQLARWQESEAVLAAASGREGDLADRLALVMARSANLLFGLMDLDGARAVVTDALDGLPADEVAGEDAAGADLAGFELRGRLAVIEVYAGHPSNALELLGPRPPAPSTTSDASAVESRRASLRRRAVWAMAGVPALNLLCRTTEAAEIATAAHAEHTELGNDIGLPGAGSHIIALAHTMEDHGDLPMAAQLAGAGYQGAVLAGALIAQVWFALHLGRTALVQGHAASAARWFRESLSLCTSSNWIGPRGMATSGLAAGTALGGDLDAAARAVADLQSFDDTFRFLQPERCLGPAWLAMAAGRPDDARAALREGAVAAATSEQHGTEAWLLHELARLGDGAEVVDRLTELEVATTSPLVAVRAAHVRAELARDPVAVTEAAERFETMGCDLAAAEAFASAADLVRAAGDQRQANQLAGRASSLLERCEGARSARLLPASSVVPLSPREREIAVLAAAGVQSKEIAERLFVSVRTVNNHLQNVYTKLGVSGRAELRAALDREAVS